MFGILSGFCLNFQNEHYIPEWQEKQATELQGVFPCIKTKFLL